MTHGCLKIYNNEKGDNRDMWMHTYHSGYLIPEIVRAAPIAYVEKRWSFLVEDRGESKLWNDYKSKKDVWDHVKNLAFGDGLFYAPSASSWLISCRPGVLEPITHNFQRDLPKWSGLDDPSILIMNEKKGTWEFTGWDEHFTIKPIQMCLDWIYQQAKLKHKRKKK